MARTRRRIYGVLLGAWAFAAAYNAAPAAPPRNIGFNPLAPIHLGLLDAGMTTKPADNAGETTETKARPAKESSAGVEDEMEDRQSFNTYTSLEDGQPGQPGELQINHFTGWSTRSGESDAWLMRPEIEYTFNHELLRNTKVGLDVPLEMLNGGVDGNGDIEFHWIQRWIAEDPSGWWPTFSTINELRVPSGYHSSGVDWTLTFVMAKELGPGTAYLNAFFESANGRNNLEEADSWWDQVRGEEGDDLRNFQWGFRFGYKWRITDTFAIIADYVLETSELRGEADQHTGEVSAEWRINDKLSLGPGVMFTWDGSDNHQNFGAGVTVHYSFW